VCSDSQSQSPPSDSLLPKAAHKAESPPTEASFSSEDLFKESSKVLNSIPFRDCRVVGVNLRIVSEIELN